MKVFISYAREDFNVAKDVYDALAKFELIKPWLDQESLLPGNDWKDEILNVIEKSRFIIILLSNNSIDKRGFFQSEIKEAIKRFSDYPDNDIYLIPVRIDKCNPPRDIQDIQYLDLFVDFEKAANKIIKTIVTSAKKDFINEKKSFSILETDLIKQKSDLIDKISESKEKNFDLKKKRKY